MLCSCMRLLFYSHSLSLDKKQAFEMYTVGDVPVCGEKLVMDYSTVTGTEGRGCVPQMGHCHCEALSYLQIPVGTGLFSLRHIISESFF